MEEAFVLKWDSTAPPCPNPTESERAVTEPGPYPKVILSEIRHETHTVLSA